MKKIIFLVAAMLAANASAGDATCKAKIMATDGNSQQSLDVHHITLMKNGVVVTDGMSSAIRVNHLDCGKSYTAIIRKMGKDESGEYTRAVKTKTRTFTASASARIFINMSE